MLLAKYFIYEPTKEYLVKLDIYPNKVCPTARSARPRRTGKIYRTMKHKYNATQVFVAKNSKNRVKKFVTTVLRSTIKSKGLTETLNFVKRTPMSLSVPLALKN